MFLFWEGLYFLAVSSFDLTALRVEERTMDWLMGVRLQALPVARWEYTSSGAGR